MSLDALMNQVVTVRTPTGESRDEIGEATTTWSSLSTTMYLEPSHGGAGSWSDGREADVERNTPIGDWLGIGRIEVTFASDCQIDYGDRTFDLVAPPRLFRNPRRRADDHWELSLQEVT